MLVNILRPMDKVSIVVYTGTDRVVLDATSGAQKEKIMEAIDNLKSGGSTNGEGGIQKAYEIAGENFDENGNNRVILLTDGDFNVGISDIDGLVNFISEKRETGVYLSVFGFGGIGGYGYDGNYFYIDTKEEARRAFVHSYSGFMLAVANDVKVQVEFNPEKVKGYRLIGYENRVLDNDDFNNDSVDAGELGSGTNVTAFYEIIPASSSEAIPENEGFEDQTEDTQETDYEETELNDIEYTKPKGDHIMALRIRYKDPDSDSSKVIENMLSENDYRNIPSLKFLFGAAVTEFGMLLRHSQFIEDGSLRNISSRISPAKKADADGSVEEFIDLINTAISISE